MIRFHGIENITPRMRKFAAEFPNKAARAMRSAAEMTVVERAKLLFDTMQPFAPHNWKSDLKESIKATTTRKNPNGGGLQKYASIVVQYGPIAGGVSSKGYWKRFESGGMHKDWPFERMFKWAKEKHGFPDEMARDHAVKVITKLNEDGARSYPILEKAWEESKEEFIVEWRANLRAEFSGSTDSVPF